MKSFEHESSLPHNQEDTQPLSGMELALAMSAWMKAKEQAQRTGELFTEPRPNSRAYFEAQRKILNEKSQKEQQEKVVLEKSKKEEFISRPILESLHIVGNIELPEEETKKEKKIIKNLFENPETLKKLKEKLKPVYEHRPDPMHFIGIAKGTEFEKEYTQEAIEKDIKYYQISRLGIEMQNAQYGESLKDKNDSSFEHGEILQTIIIDRINNGWIPEMEAIMTHDIDDLKAGIDSVMQYKKEAYFGASFDMTISEKPEIIEHKIQKNWEYYVFKGKVPYVKYFEDPKHPETRGRRVMPKFVIGGSREDLEQLTNAYLADDMTVLDMHPLKYAVIAQVDAQLEKILDFYNKPENILHFKFNHAREQYIRFKEFLNDIKQSIQYDQVTAENPEVKKYIENNKVYQISKEYIPRTDFINERKAA